MINAFRIVRTKFAAKAFEGIGSRIAGGRWNSPGAPVIYTSASQALAMLEMLVHLHAEEALLSYTCIAITFDDSILEVVNSESLPADWKMSHKTQISREIGDRWLGERAKAVLQVPSAIVPEPNYLLNPIHPDFSKIKIGKPAKIEFDPRLFKS